MRTTDIQTGGEGGALRFRERGFTIAFPLVPGTFTAGTGVPINGTIGYAPGCIWVNWLGSAGGGTLLYYNTGTSLSSLWLNIDSVIQQNQFPIVTMSAATVALTPAANSLRTNLFNRSAGVTATLPSATGTGDWYEFQVLTVSTANVVSTNGTDVFKGAFWLSLVGTTTLPNEVFTTTTLKNITLNGTTTGGLTIGDSFRVRDVAANVWVVDNAQVTASGTMATPFS